MKNMFEAVYVEDIKDRLQQLQPDSKPLWGTMNAAQAVAHCSLGVEMATGDLRPPRVMIGRILGPMIKSKALGDDEPIRKNSPTAKALVVQDYRDLAAERERLTQLIDQFFAAGPQGCTNHPHAFFGTLSPEQWAILMYKHLDHHLRQFSV